MLLDLGHCGVIKALRRAGVEAMKVVGSGHAGNSPWLWRREQVEQIAAERVRVARLKAEGKKLCHRCETWKDREGDFRGRDSWCRQCMTEKNKEAWAKRKREQAGLASRVAAVVQEAEVEERPRTGSDGSEYACMDIGFSHRPLPIVKTLSGWRRMSKRVTYCQICAGKYCYFHPEVTPKELVRRWKIGEGRMAAGMS